MSQPQQDMSAFDDDLTFFMNTDFLELGLDLDVPVSDFAFDNGPQQHSQHQASSPLVGDNMGFPSAYYHTMSPFAPANLSEPNSLPPSPPNGLPFAGQLQQSQPTIPSAQHIAALLSSHQPPPQQQAGQKRKAGSISSSNPKTLVELEEHSHIAAEEDKRRRNTAASARFRVKKKQREQALEQTAKDMTDRVHTLEARISQLEMENKWLKGLVTEKNVALDVVPESETAQDEAAVPTAADAPGNGVDAAGELVQAGTSLDDEKLVAALVSDATTA